MSLGWTLKKALKCKGLPANFKEWRAIAIDRSEWRSQLCFLPRIDPAGFMRVKMKISLRKRHSAQSDSAKRSSMLFLCNSAKQICTKVSR